jgi:Tfp pilus assembly protein PilF
VKLDVFVSDVKREGIAYFALGQTQKAASAVRQATVVAPEYEGAWCALYKFTDRFTESLEAGLRCFF